MNLLQSIDLLALARSAALFVVVLGALVFFHEFGHFWVARRCGVTVLTFSLGFGPKLFTRKRGDTEYCLSAIPLGGYVRMLGDDPTQELSEEMRVHAFLTQPIPQKIAIASAGPGFNLLLAILIFTGVYLSGVPVLTPHVGEVQKGSAAEAGGLKPDDLILSIDGEALEEWESLRPRLQAAGGKESTFVVERGGAQVTLRITPRQQETEDIIGTPETRWLIGIQPKGTQTIRHYGPVEAVGLALSRTWEIARLNVVSIVKMVQGKISSDNIGGPILIAQMASQQAREGLRNIALFTAVISVSLGVMNLFPVPILDGGHILFFLVEAILGRPLTIKTQERAQQAGMALLGLLMVFALYNDLVRLFTS